MAAGNVINRVTGFVVHHQWMADLQNAGRFRRFLLSAVRTLTLAAFEFVRNKCSLRASWLTLIFMFSLAPALALGFSIAKGFQAQERVKVVLYRTVGIENELGQPIAGSENIRSIIDPMMKYVNETNVGALGLAGLLAILYTAYSVLNSIEKTLNDIWNIRRRRPIIRRIIDYVAVLFVFPLMLILTALVVAALRTGAVRDFLEGVMPAAVVSLLGAAVALSSALLGFWFLYYFFPNTRVRVLSALAGAVVAAVCWAAVQYLFVRLQVGVAKYNAIYGTFAAVPIFLLWLQTSWMVILFGAEVSYAHAHRKEFSYAGLKFNPSPAFCEKASLGIMAIAAQRFSEEKAPPTLEQFSHELISPVRILREMVHHLVAEHLLMEVHVEGKIHYQPACPVEHITVGRVLNAVRRAGDDPEHMAKAFDRLGIQQVLTDHEKALHDFGNTPILRYVPNYA